MNDESLTRLERALGNIPPQAPAELRDLVLGRVNKQLAGARRERRLVRATALLLVIGIAVNVRVGGQHDRPLGNQIASKPTQETLIDVGISVAEATDLETGNRIACHMATLSGSTLTSEQAATIQQAIQKRVSPILSSRKAG